MRVSYQDLSDLAVEAKQELLRLDNDIKNLRDRGREWRNLAHDLPLFSSERQAAFFTKNQIIASVGKLEKARGSLMLISDAYNKAAKEVDETERAEQGKQVDSHNPKVCDVTPEERREYLRDMEEANEHNTDWLKGEEDETF